MRRPAPSARDIQQAVYLSLVDIFVVDDLAMKAHLEDVARLAELDPEMVEYDQLVIKLRSDFPLP
jgi:hypothetical protein